MARGRRGRKRRGHKSKAFPILLAAPIVPGAWTVVKQLQAGQGAGEALRSGVYEMTGIDLSGQGKLNTAKTMQTAGLLIVGLAGHKIASRVGINRIMKKATMGFLQL